MTTTEEFYADTRRLHSREVDYGVWWHDSGGSYRITWVETTGEVYAARMTPRPTAIEILGVLVSREAVDAALDGWADWMYHPNSLSRARTQIQDLSLTYRIDDAIEEGSR